MFQGTSDGRLHSMRKTTVLLSREVFGTKSRVYINKWRSVVIHGGVEQLRCPLAGYSLKIRNLKSKDYGPVSTHLC